MNILRRCWYVASWSSELVQGELLPVMIGGEAIVLFRGADGVPVALKNRCSHRFAPLSKGRLEGGTVRCMYHGLRFSPSGECIEIPGQDRIPVQASVKAFPVIERNDWIWVWMGEPELADPILIPESVPLNHPDWAMAHGKLDYEANYLLINDNLLDFSHFSFVHATSFGAGSGWADTRPTVTALERGVRIARWLENQPRSNSRPDISDRFIDHYSVYEYLVPGVLYSTAYSFPLGTARLCAGNPPSAELKPIYGTITSQAVTPRTATSCRYFFSRGLPRSHAAPEVVEQMMRVTYAAFEEDRVIIEAQQKVLLTAGEDRMFATTADKALMMFRRILVRLQREEASSND